MKKISRILIFILVLIMLLSVEVIAHGGNITGWKDKDSVEITQYNGKYYGYHNKVELDIIIKLSGTKKNKNGK